MQEHHGQNSHASRPGKQGRLPDITQRPNRSSSRPRDEEIISPPRAVPQLPQPNAGLARAQSVGAVPRDKEGGRQMFDKNELRSMHGEMFHAAILKMRHFVMTGSKDEKHHKSCRIWVFDLLLGHELFLVAEQKEEEQEGTRGALQVFLRKRPLSEKEQQVRAEYDALTVIPRKPYSNEVVLHNCQFQADLKTPFITHIHYGFDCVFPEDVSNEVVYGQTAQPLVQIAINGGMATMFMFGQTGHGLASSGKTFTMTAIEDFAARDLFASRPADVESSSASDEFLSLQFYELRGNRCFDLLAPWLLPRCTRFVNFKAVNV
eukprot:Skav200736  [mRNA]  locus=scaffold274:233232:234572:- [translate_table: standard]